MRDVHVGLDHAEHGESVHFWHHDIGDNDVVRAACEQFLESFLAVAAKSEVVIVSQFGRDVLAYIDVVINDQHTALL